MKPLTLGLAVAAGAAWLWAGCSDNIDSYPSTVNPVSNVVYYISGTVYDNLGHTLRGVDVKGGGSKATTTDDGTYTLAVKKAGDHTVTFSATGYLTQSLAVAIPTQSAAYSEVPLSTTLSLASTVTITPSATETTYIVASSSGTLAEAGTRPDDNAPADESSIGIDLPAGATDRTLTVTYYTDPTGVLAAPSGDIGMALGAVAISPDVTSFADGAKALITITNPIPDAAFPTLTLTNVGTTETATVAYDAASDNYAGEVTHFSRWAFLAPATVTFAASEESGHVEVDNSGNPQALRGKAISYPFVNGWTMESCTPATMEAVLTRLIANYKGFLPAVRTDTRTEDVNVAAGSILRFTYTQRARTETYSFAFADGSTATATVLQYLDLTTSFLYVGHIGGSSE